MTVLSVDITPIRHGWAVRLSNGQELARFYGPAARWRATTYLTRALGYRS